MKNVLLSKLPNLLTTANVELTKNSLFSKTISTRAMVSSNNIIVNLETADIREQYISIIENTILKNLNLKEVVTDGEVEKKYTVSNFNRISDIVLVGKYPTYKIKFPKFNLNIRVLTDISFRFILSVKLNSSDSNPQLYTSAIFYNELINSYKNNNPYMVANAIKSNAIVSVFYDEYLEKLEGFRSLELNTANVGVVVDRNLFVDSNYNLTSNALPPALEANPLVNIDELVRYVDWVVSKPSTNFDEKLLSPSEIGRWSLVSPTGIQTPPVVATVPSDDDDPLDVPSLFPPVGRPGFYQGEEITTTDNKEYIWTNNAGGRWELLDDTVPANPPPTNPNQTGPGSGGGARPPAGQSR